MIDADALAEALEAPAFKWKGQTYVGSLPSHATAVRLIERFAGLRTSAAADQEEVIRQLAAAAQWPADVLLAMPTAVLMEVAKGFFGSLNRLPGAAGTMPNEPGATSSSG